MVEQPSIFVRQEGNQGIVRIVGKGSFTNARLVKDYAEKVRQSGIQQFLVDLGECTYMDSTFMGVLAGLASTQKRLGFPSPRLVRVNARNRELLETLGLSRVLDLEPTLGTCNGNGFQEVSISPDCKQDTARTMLEAHQNLVEVDKSNASKFQDVIRFLQQKLDAESR